MGDVTIGVDIGGTGVRAVAADPDGAPVCDFMEVALDACTRVEVLDAIDELVSRVTRASGGTPVGVGVGIPAFLTLPDGIVRLAPNLSDLNGWRAADAIRERLDLPAVIENDANAAAFGEAWAGAGRGHDPFVFYGMGTGLGGGIVLGGTVLHGVHGLAGELGHQTVYPAGAPCGCGAAGCVEAYASATGILRSFTEATANLPDDAFSARYGPREMLDTTALAAAAKQGDPAAIQTFTEAGTALGIAIAQVMNVLNPSRIAIGGGVAATWDLFYEPLRNEVTRRTIPSLREGVDIVPAKLGRKAGAIGAAGLAAAHGAER